jgi:hypothetical protein
MPYTLSDNELSKLATLLTKIRGLVWPGMALQEAHQVTEYVLEAQELVDLVKQRGEQQPG